MNVTAYLSLTNATATISWDTTLTYKWIVVGSVHHGPVTGNYYVVDRPASGAFVQVIADDSIGYDYTQDILEGDNINSSIYVKFTAKEGAQKYRVMIDGSSDGFVDETGAEFYEYSSSPVSATARYTVDVQWQDIAGNWSSAEHPYYAYMYVVPTGSDFEVDVTGGTLQIRSV